MHVTLEKESLLKVLGHVHRVVERRATIPILQNVLFAAEGEAIQVRATDLDIEITDRLPADVRQDGSITLPAQLLYEIVRKLPDGAQLTLQPNGSNEQLLLISGRSRFNLQSLPESDFPNLAAGDMSHKFTIPARDLKKLIAKTQFAISTEETRYYLNGIYMHTVETGGVTMLRAVATDGHRLAHTEVVAPSGAAGIPGVILPRKTVGELLKLIEDVNEDVLVEISSTKARFSLGNVVLLSKLIDGTFPDYARVIPTANSKLITIEKNALAAAVSRVATISSERGHSVKFAASDERLALSVSNPDSGSANEEIEIDYDGAPIEIGFNARYLGDLMAQFEGENVLVKLQDPGSPAVIVDPEDSATLTVLMPMRVS